MGTRDARVTAYVAKQRDFARPILEHLRELVHDACADCEETLKWGMPSFTYHGEILCSFAAFKEHASFGFWRHGELLGRPRGNAMGSFGRLATARDLPPKRELVALIRRAMALTDAGPRPKATTRERPKARKAPPVPKDLRDALARDPKARATFESFSPSARREYVQWITEAKRAGTRAARVRQAVEWLAEGKQRNWKYM